MLDFMKNYEKHTYALMRIMAGFLFLWHGTSKYLSYPRVSPAEGYVKILGGGIELIGGVLIMVAYSHHPLLLKLGLGSAAKNRLPAN